MYYIAIVGPEDKSLYEAELGPSRQGDSQHLFPPSVKELSSYVVHASLDVVDEIQWTTPALYLKEVDRFYGYLISAFVTPGNTRILLLHMSRNEEAIRQFFLDTWDAFVKALLSPFYKQGEPIENPHFDTKIRQLARKHL